MKNWKLYLLPLCALLVYSCSKETDDSMTPGPESGKDLSYTLTGDSVVMNLTQFFNGINYINALENSQKSMIQGLVMLHIPGNSDKVHAYGITYESIDPDGNPVKLSASVLIPEDVVQGKKQLDRTILANHFSITENAACPSLSYNIEGMVAWCNSAVIMPDYYGFGASSGHCQAYLNPDVTARGNIDALNAAFELMEQLGIKKTGKLFNLGYSQGGFNAMANLKYINQHPECGIVFDNTLAGGGPYNVMRSFESYLSGGFESVFPLVLLTIVSFNENEHLGIDYSDLFKGELLTNWKEWIMSGKYSTGQISALLGNADPEEHLTEQICQLEGDAFEKLNGVSERFSLNKNWTPAAGTKLTLYHTPSDDMVPFTNYEDMKAFLDAFTSSCDITFKTSAAASHVLGYFDFFLDCVLTSF